MGLGLGLVGCGLGLVGCGLGLVGCGLGLVGLWPRNIPAMFALLNNHATLALFVKPMSIA